MLFMRAKLLNIFPTKAFTDPESGVVTLAGHKIQVQTTDYVADKNEKGEDVFCPKIVLRDLNVKQANSTWKAFVGRTVEFPVAAYKDESGRIGFYLPPKYTVTPVADDKA